MSAVNRVGSLLVRSRFCLGCRHAESFLLRGFTCVAGVWLVGGSHAINVDSLCALRRCVVPFLSDASAVGGISRGDAACSIDSGSAAGEPRAAAPLASTTAASSLPLAVVAGLLERVSAAGGGDRVAISMAAASLQIPAVTLGSKGVPLRQATPRL